MCWPQSTGKIGIEMKIVKFYLGTGNPSCSYEEIVEFDDDTTDEEIEAEYQSWKEDRLDCSWWEVTE